MAKTKTKDDEIPPFVRARTRGRYGTLMNRIANAFREENPGKAVYWAFDPEHSPEASQVTAREMMGYEIVDAESDGYLKDILPNAGTKVRVGDVTLMAIRSDWRDMILEQKAQAAKEQENVAERSFRDKVQLEGGSDKLMTPTGRISRKEESITAEDIGEGES